MQKAKNVSQYVIAYIMWIASFLLWALFIVMGREVLLAVVRSFYVKTSFLRGLQVSLIDRVFFLTTGIIWLILMVVVEHYFRTGVQKGQLALRIGKVFTPILLLIFIAHATRLALIGFSSIPLTGLLMLGGELVLIGLAIWLALRKPAKPAIKAGEFPVK